jgi:hypothetical protein
MELDGSLQSILAILVTVATSGWLGSVLVEWLKGRSTRAAALSTAALGREGQLDDLTKDLIQTARSTIAELRSELAILRPLQTHLLHFEESISHLEAIVFAKDEEAVSIARAGAAAFLDRIKRARQAIGTIRQEAQVLKAEAAITRNRAAERAEGLEGDQG